LALCVRCACVGESGRGESCSRRERSGLSRRGAGVSLGSMRAGVLPERSTRNLTACLLLAGPGCQGGTRRVGGRWARVRGGVERSRPLAGGATGEERRETPPAGRSRLAVDMCGRADGYLRRKQGEVRCRRGLTCNRHRDIGLFVVASWRSLRGTILPARAPRGGQRAPGEASSVACRGTSMEDGRMRGDGQRCRGRPGRTHAAVQGFAKENISACIQIYNGVANLKYFCDDSQ